MALLSELKRDCQYALRGFARAPDFAFTAILTLALGAGATTAVFSVVDRLLFRPLPYSHPEQLVSVGLAAPIEPVEFMLGSDYVEWRVRQRPFQAMAVWAPGTQECDLTSQPPQRISCQSAEAALLPLLGIKPMLGRNFEAAEDRPEGPKVALISYGLWQSRFGGATSVLNQTMALDGQPVSIIGVLPRDFEFPTLAKVDALLPLGLDDAAQRRPKTGRVLRSIARLKPGVSTILATSQLQPLFEESLGFVPPQFRKEVKLRVRDWRDGQAADIRLASWILLAAVGALMLIACGNVANLLLARSVTRRQEMAVRAALGASRSRLIRQTLIESMCLGLAGGLAGCLLAVGLLRTLVWFAPPEIPRIADAAVDWRVLAFLSAASVFTGLLAGTTPALAIHGTSDLATRHHSSGPRHLAKHLLVAAQFALSLALVTGAGLLLRSLWQLQATPLGLDSRRVLAATIALGANSYPEPARQWAFWRDLEDRVARIPGFDTVAVTDTVPPGGQTRSMLFAAIDVEGRPRFAEGTGGMVVWRAVSPSYFRVLGIPVRQGREFRLEDRRSPESLVVLGESLAKRLFPGESPLNKRINAGRTETWMTVVGVVPDVKNAGIQQAPDPEYYVLRKVQPSGPMRKSTLLIRTSAKPQAAGEWIRQEVARLDPSLPVEVDTLNERIDRLAARPRFNAWMLGIFSTLGLALAAIGLYGVTAFLVTARTGEIAIRMAFGANRRQIAAMVMNRAAMWCGVGAAAGLAMALVFARLLRPLLFKAPALDWLTPVSALSLLAASALLAAWLPARRASRLDPIAALRRE